MIKYINIKNGGEIMDKLTGIYKLENIVNNKVYIGQSKNLRARECQHISKLRHGKHSNSLIQLDANMHGVDSFRFTILEVCPVDKLNEREIFWISYFKSFDSEFGYNKDLGGKGKFRLVSRDTRELLSKKLEGENSNTAKITEDTAKDIVARLMHGDSIHHISKDLKISHKIIEGIRSKKKWKHLTSGITFPSKRSSKYKWVSRVPNANVTLYRAIVKSGNTKVYDKCWDTEYDAAVAREIFIRENNINNATKNFPDDMELKMPTKKRYAVSKYYGVTKETGCHNRWVAQIHLGGTHHYVGTFDSEEAAAQARDNYIKKHFPNANVKVNTFN